MPVGCNFQFQKYLRQLCTSLQQNPVGARSYHDPNFCSWVMLSAAKQTGHSLNFAGPN